MARFAFKLPDIGEGISKAEIVAWHVKVGDRVEEDQCLADMMTDKATVEMESPVSGTVIERAGEVGDQVAIGAPLVMIETDAVEEPAPVSEPTPVSEPALVSEAVEEQIRAETPDAGEAQPDPRTERAGAGDHPATPPASLGLASPAVRARAANLGIDLGQVKTGGDRVRHADLDAYLRYGSGQGYHDPQIGNARPDEPIKVIGMRRRIAENMAAAKRSIPHFTYIEEIDVTEFERVRADLNAHRGSRPKLTMLPLLIVAICKAIPDFPMMNARYDDDAGVVTRHGRIHLGLATQTPAGLMVPVIRDAQDRNVWQLANEIGRLAEAARTGTATVADLSGSTLTITSLGPLGGVATTPVINRPEVAIIGPNKVVERPVFASREHQGDVVRRAKLMNLSISCDHRVVDGWDAASFIQVLKRYLETPVLLFST